MEMYYSSSQTMLLLFMPYADGGTAFSMNRNGSQKKSTDQLEKLDYSQYRFMLQCLSRDGQVRKVSLFA